MTRIVEIPREMADRLRRHLFQGELEEGAFIFARLVEERDVLTLEGLELYLVPPEGWRVQTNFRLEMTDEERVKILKLVRDKDLCLIDCHSHPASNGDVWFSPSDRDGIEEFAPYVRWKLDGKLYAAMVWGEDSVDAVVWEGDFEQPRRIDEIHITGEPYVRIIPTDTWFRPSRKAKRWSHG